jgi:phage terminase large subunit GpA-like protein
VNVSKCKSELYGYLMLERPKDSEPYPRGWVHFASDLEEEFFRQLVSEEFRVEVRNGVRKFRWEPIQGRRHEALDCHNYARAAAFILGWDRAEDDDWKYLEARIGLPPAFDAQQPAAAPLEAPKPEPVIAPPPAPRRETQTVIASSFMRSFLG